MDECMRKKWIKTLVCKIAQVVVKDLGLRNVQSLIRIQYINMNVNYEAKKIIQKIRQCTLYSIYKIKGF